MHVISIKVENYKCNQIWQYWEEMSAAGHGDCVSIQQTPGKLQCPSGAKPVLKKRLWHKPEFAFHDTVEIIHWHWDRNTPKKALAVPWPIAGLACFTEDDMEIWIMLFESPDPWLLYSPVIEAATFGATRLSLSSQRALHTTSTHSQLEPAPCATHRPRHRNQRELGNFCNARGTCWVSLETVGGLRVDSMGGNNIKPSGNSNRTEWNSNARHKAACNQAEGFHSSLFQTGAAAAAFCSCLY